MNSPWKRFSSKAAKRSNFGIDKECSTVIRLYTLADKLVKLFKKIILVGKRVVFELAMHVSS